MDINFGAAMADSYGDFSTSRNIKKIKIIVEGLWTKIAGHGGIST